MDQLYELVKRFSKDLTWKSFSIIKIQSVLVVILFIGLLGFFANLWAVIVVQAFLSVFYFKILFYDLKKHFIKDFYKYALFFSGIYVFAELIWLLPGVYGLSDPVLATKIVLYELAGLVVFIMLFKLVFGVRTIKCRVLASSRDLAVVETDFNLLAFCKAGKYIAEASKKHREGETVSVEMSRGFARQKPYRII